MGEPEKLIDLVTTTLPSAKDVLFNCQIGNATSPSESKQFASSTLLTNKEKYRALKRRFKFLVYENEFYQEEMRNQQRKLMKLSRDRNFLLDRLLMYQRPSDSSDESDGAPSKKVKRPRLSKKRDGPKNAGGDGSQACTKRARKSNQEPCRLDSTVKKPTNVTAESLSVLLPTSVSGLSASTSDSGAK